MINETNIDTQIAELGRLADKVTDLYGMSLKMRHRGYSGDLYAGVNAMLHDAMVKYREYRKRLKSVGMSEEDREKIQRIIKRTKEKIRRMKKLG